MNQPERPCCRTWRDGRATIVRRAQAFNELSGGSPRALSIFYDELKSNGLSADDIHDIFDPTAACPHFAGGKV